jgi:Aminoglycoside adenylyltransferase, C-terminal domain/Nucleotidyltransferase domain
VTLTRREVAVRPQTARVRTIPDPIASILPPLVDDLRSTLDGDLVGVYLYGSAISGGFEPNASDLDLVIVTERDAGDLDLGVLDAIHARLAAREPAWAHRLDLAYVGRATLADFRSGGSVLSISHDDPLQRSDDADGWLQTWYLVREADTPIVGPPAADLIPVITPDEFVRAVALDADRVVGFTLTDVRSGPLTYTILTLCRVLIALETSTIVSKQAAAEATARERPAWRWLLEACLRVRREEARLPLRPDEQVAAPLLIAELHRDVRERRTAI